MKHKLICGFKLVTDMVRGRVRKFVYDMDRPGDLVGWHKVTFL